MTTESKVRTGSTPLLSQRTRAYDADLYGWVEDQVALLKAGRLSEIDAVNIADELGDVGGEQYDKLESAVRVILLHLLKWDFQSERRSRSWVLSVGEHRRRIVRILQKNPSLRPKLEEAIREAYEDARGDAMNETGLAAAVFPRECPYDWSAVTTRAVEWDDLRSPQD
jgi:hypothetical protein